MDDSIINKIKELVALGENEEAMKLALNYFKEKDKAKENNIRLLLSQLRIVQKNILLGISKETTELNRIIASFITELSEDSTIPKGQEISPWKNRNRNYIILVLSISLVTISVKFYSNSHFSNEALVNKYSEETMISYSTARSQLPSKYARLEIAVDLFMVGKYRDAIKQYEYLKSSDSTLANICNYGIGTSYLFLKEFKTSIDYFEECISLGDISSTVFEQAEWGIILAKIGDGQLDQKFHKNLREKNLNIDALFYRYSTSLEKDLDSIWRKIAEI